MKITNRRSLRSLILLLAFAMLAVSCAGGGGDDDGGAEAIEGDPVPGGTLVLGAEQFPADLNCFDALNNIAWCYYMSQIPVLWGAYEQMPDFTFRPQLLDGEAEVEEGPPFKVTYNIKEAAAWSDGTPITAEDFKFSAEVLANKKNGFISTSGYELMTEMKINDEKSITFTFSEPYAPYKGLFSGTSGYLYPAHILDGEDMTKVWNTCICDPATGDPVSSGPFLLTDFKKNSRIVLEANKDWWGTEEYGGPYLDGIEFKYVAETSTQIEQVRGGEVDAIYPTWQLELKALTTQPNLKYEVDAGTFWQHLDIQFDKKPLNELFVRQAIFHGIDREAIVKRLVIPGQEDAIPLESLVYVANQPEYEPHFDIYNYDPAKAAQLLEDNGCTKGSDGIYECGGERLSFEYKSTAGNNLRELMFQIIQAQLKEVGIEVENGFGEADVVFTDLAQEKYELFQFGWVGSPDPSGAVEIYKCEGDQNYQGYCNEEVTKLLDETDRTVDAAARTALFNQAGDLMAQDAPSLPLWQAPQPLIVQDYVNGAAINATQGGPLWNAQEIWIEESAQ